MGSGCRHSSRIKTFFWAFRMFGKAKTSVNRIANRMPLLGIKKQIEFNDISVIQTPINW
jgi:hypothetical protein